MSSLLGKVLGFWTSGFQFFGKFGVYSYLLGVFQACFGEEDEGKNGSKVRNVDKGHLLSLTVKYR